MFLDSDTVYKTSLDTGPVVDRGSKCSRTSMVELVRCEFTMCVS